MSRAAAAKTRAADKTKPPASQTPVIAHEIVPGKFNDNDWNQMVGRDGCDEFIQDIVDELMDTTMATIYNKYIEAQLLPFTITQARDAIIEIIEWRFLERDEGEQHIESDLGWSQDEEPEPATTDCWAQGSVPKNFIAAPTPPLDEIPEEEEEAQAEVPPLEEAPKEPPEVADYVSDTDESPADDVKPSAEEVTAEGEPKKTDDDASRKSAGSNRKSKTKFRPYRGKMKSAGVSKMTQSLEETEMQMIYDEISASMPASEEKPSTLLNMPASCTSILKVQTGRPPGNKDVVYDDHGNVVAVMKLDPEKLPTHKVSVKYHVVDPAVEAAQARLDAMRKGKSTGRFRKSSVKKSIVTSDSVSTLKSSKPGDRSSKVAPLPPPLKRKKSIPKVPSFVIDKQNVPPTKVAYDTNNQMTQEIEEMEVSHGVIVREGGRVKKGPGRYYGKLDVLDENQQGMQPVAVRITNPGITVADLLDRHTPILRPLGESSPLPPIMPHPPPYQQSQQVS